MQLGNPAQGAPAAIWIEDPERAVGRDEHVFEREVVAAGAAQAGHRPRVDDVDLACRQHHHPQRRHAAVVHHAVGDEPVGVLATAGERPPTARTEAAIDDRGDTRRVERSGDHDVGTIGVHDVKGRGRQLADDHRCRTADHHRPSDRPVGDGQFAEELQVFTEACFGAAEAARDQHAEASRRTQTVHQVAWETSSTLDLVATGHDVRDQFPHGGDNHRRRGRRCGRLGHTGTVRTTSPMCKVQCL